MWMGFAFIAILFSAIGFYEWRQRAIQKDYKRRLDDNTKIASGFRLKFPFPVTYEYHTFTFSNMDIESGRANVKLNEYGDHGWRICGQWAIGNFLHVFMEKATNHEQPK